MNSPESGRPETTIVPYGTRVLEEYRLNSSYPSQSPKEPTLRDYWHILLRRKWTIASFLLIVMTLVSVISLRMQAKYESWGRIAVSRETPEVLGLHNDNTGGTTNAVDDISLLLETQVQVLRSQQLSLDVAHKLRSAAPKGPIPEINSVSSLTPLNLTPPTPEEISLAGRLRGGLSVSIVPRTQILEIRYKDPDPNMAAKVVQAYIDCYLENNFDSKFQSIKQTTEWLTQQLSDLQLKVEVSQEKLVRYQREHNIVGVDDKQNITTSRLDDLNKQLTDAELDRIVKQTRFEGAKHGDAELIAKTESGALIGKLRDNEADLNNKLAQATVTYGPAYPKVQELKSQLAQTEQAIVSEQRKMLAGLQSDYQVALQREKMLRGEFEKQKSAANTLNESAIQYNILKRDVDTNRQLYEGLLQRLKEAGVVAGLKSSNITVIDPARIPKSPSEPDIPRNLMLGFMVGLLGGIGLAIVVELMDNTVNLPEDVEVTSGLPVIGVVPATRQIVDGKSKSSSGFKMALSKPPLVSPTPLLAHERPQSQVAEAYRALRTSVLLSSTPPKVILVTSALPQEGKTTTATNLAIVLAQRGSRVLLIDGDLRRPRIHKFFKGTQAFGLSTLLNGQDELLKVISATPVPELSAIFAGPTPPQPAEMLSSDRMRRHLAEWRNEYDHIVIDSPPILSVTDAALLSVEADSVLLVIRSGQTTKDALRRASDLLIQVKARVQGVVVNAIDMDQPHYYYYYGTNYGAYYRDNA